MFQHHARPEGGYNFVVHERDAARQGHGLKQNLFTWSEVYVPQKVWSTRSWTAGGSA